ncbi:hypothetical protein P154DRAFT_539389 [Amniculicola lignicola CBS 123094]|uniref:F-box domain-containing protein n=1 Tax=Amniculicola lignicola CBS 123094 TaxID=1392246 RepID=A0A6A5WAK1_9PLEO|nr:hypothetical protein P154DRAFT_539389 [Amniculicola lignicola CBS 123094]
MDPVITDNQPRGQASGKTQIANEGSDDRPHITLIPEPVDEHQSLDRTQDLVVPAEAFATLSADEVSQSRSTTESIHIPEKDLFPIMKLPPELRIMIFKYALHIPGGEIIREHIQGSRAKHFIGSKGRRTFPVNPLALVSKQVYQESRGLALEVNTIREIPLLLSPFPAAGVLSTLNTRSKQAFETD